jgi:drug/metabolite transporter (DMT)-like permease
MTASEGSRRVALGALTMACMAWGLSFVLINDVDEILADRYGWSLVTAASWGVAMRFLLASAVLVPWPVVRRGLSWPVLRDGLWLALPSAAGYVLQAAGMRGVEPGTNAFLTSLYTPFTPLLGWLLFRRVPAGRVLAAVPVALAGVAMLTRIWKAAGGGFGFHEGLVVAGAVCWAFQILLIDRFGRRHPTGPFSGAYFLWTGVLGLVALATLGDARVEDALAAAVLPEIQVPIWGLALLATVFTLMMIIRYQPRIDPSRAALLYVAEPVFAAIFAVLIDGEPFEGWKLVGCATLLAANVMVEVRRRPVR